MRWTLDGSLELPSWLKSRYIGVFACCALCLAACKEGGELLEGPPGEEDVASGGMSVEQALREDGARSIVEALQPYGEFDAYEAGSQVICDDGSCRQEPAEIFATRREVAVPSGIVPAVSTVLQGERLADYGVARLNLEGADIHGRCLFVFLLGNEVRSSGATLRIADYYYGNAPSYHRGL